MTELELARLDPPVTIAVVRRVRAGREEEFEAFLKGIVAAASRFPGYLGADVLRPSGPPDRTYRVTVKFDHDSARRRWEESEERQRWLALAEELIEEPARLEVISGLETWFTLPGGATLQAPPRHKMAVVSWLAIWPLATLIFALTGELLAPLPLPLRTMLTTAALTLLMTYLVMPRMTRIFARWLYPGRG